MSDFQTVRKSQKNNDENANEQKFAFRRVRNFYIFEIIIFRLTFLFLSFLCEFFFFRFGRFFSLASFECNILLLSSVFIMFCFCSLSFFTSFSMNFDFLEICVCLSFARTNRFVFPLAHFSSVPLSTDERSLFDIFQPNKIIANNFPLIVYFFAFSSVCFHVRIFYSLTFFLFRCCLVNPVTLTALTFMRMSFHHFRTTRNGNSKRT